MTDDNRNEEDWKKIHLMQNVVRVAVCMVSLSLTVGAVRLTSNSVQKHLAAKKQTEVAQKSPKQPKVEKTTKAQKEEKKPETKKNYTVCLDAGHGGSDGGSTEGARKESEDTMRITQVLQKELQDRGITVVMTREADDYVDLDERVAVANNANADFFVSLHRNKGEGYGMETWISSQPDETAQALGQNIHDKIVAVGVQRDRGLKLGSQSGSGNYYVIRCSNMPACLIELGFVNNNVDNDNFDAKYEEYAAAIADGIEETAHTCKNEALSQRYEEHQKVLESATQEGIDAAAAVPGTETAPSTQSIGIEASHSVDKSLDSMAN